MDLGRRPLSSAQCAGAAQRRRGGALRQQPNSPGPGGVAPREPVHSCLRSARGAGGVSAAAHDPELALLRQLSHRSPGAGPAIAPRHPHAIVGGRWRRSCGCGADDFRNRGWRGPAGCHRRGLSGFPAHGGHQPAQFSPAAPPARAASPPGGSRTLRWHAALSAAGGSTI